MKRSHKKRSVAPDPSGDGYGYLRRRGLSRKEIARGHNQGVGHNSGTRSNAGQRDKDDDRKADRPSLGSGMAEGAARDIENRGSNIDRAVDKAMGRRDDEDD